MRVDDDDRAMVCLTSRPICERAISGPLSALSWKDLPAVDHVPEVERALFDREDSVPERIRDECPELVGSRHRFDAGSRGVVFVLGRRPRLAAVEEAPVIRRYRCSLLVEPLSTPAAS